jgi:hypothetical protein
MARKIKLFVGLVMLLASLGTVDLGYSHSGGLDANGGHHDRKNGGYHYHRGPIGGCSSCSDDGSSGVSSLESYHHDPYEVEEEAEEGKK